MSNLNWIPMSNEDQLSQIVSQSQDTPCLIFKHSTRCSISSMAKMRLESGWNFDSKELKVYYLDLIAHRNVSNQVAEELSVHHESPQMILLDKGEVVLDASHLDCTVEEIRSVYNPV